MRRSLRNILLRTNYIGFSSTIGNAYGNHAVRIPLGFGEYRVIKNADTPYIEKSSHPVRVTQAGMGAGQDQTVESVKYHVNIPGLAFQDRGRRYEDYTDTYSISIMYLFMCSSVASTVLFWPWLLQGEMK